MGVIDRIFGRSRRARRQRGRRALGLGRAALVRGDTARAIELAREALLDAPDDSEILHLMADALRGEDAVAVDLFARAANSPDDLQRVFELGSHLLSTERPQLACVFLERALTFAPFDAVIRSELAIAQARSGLPGDAVETLALHPCLVDDPGALFEFGWASLLCGDVEAARGARDELAAHGTARALTKKLDHAIRRAAVPPVGSPPDARDFLFLEHGSVLLVRELDASGALGRYGRVALDEELIGRILGSAAYVVRSLCPRPRRVLAADSTAAPLADALAAAVEGAREPLREGRVPAGVIVASSARELAALGARLDAPAGEVMSIVLSLDWSRGIARVPDLVGVLAREVSFDPETARGASPREAEDAGLAAFVDDRRAHLPPAGKRTASAYLPDAPLPWV